MNQLFKLVKKSFRQANNISITSKMTLKTYTKTHFEKICSHEINKLKNAFNNLQEYNENIDSIDYNKINDSLMISIDHVGSFQFTYDPEHSLFYYFSPLSGNYTYYYNEEEDKFYSIRDEHIMEEMLVKEILKVGSEELWSINL